MKIDINDDNVYYPLGGASYVFKNELIKYIYSKIKKKNIKISIKKNKKVNGIFLDMLINKPSLWALVKRN